MVHGELEYVCTLLILGSTVCCDGFGWRVVGLRLQTDSQRGRGLTTCSASRGRFFTLSSSSFIYDTNTEVCLLREHSSILLLTHLLLSPRTTTSRAPASCLAARAQPPHPPTHPPRGSAVSGIWHLSRLDHTTCTICFISASATLLEHCTRRLFVQRPAGVGPIQRERSCISGST